VGVFERAWLAAVPDMAREGVKSKRADVIDLRETTLSPWGMLEYRRLEGADNFELATLD
jgi:hypothetical protein